MTDERRRHGALWVALVIGLGLAVAPAIFGMFGRAPAGGQMIADFKPYMRASTLESFGADLGLIGAAHKEVVGLDSAAASGAVADFRREWPHIGDEMRSMLSTIEANVTRFEGLVALPPFWAFPWFFVLPGLMIAGLSLTALRSSAPTRRIATLALAVVGLSVVAAPAVFQMFTRAPGGAAMIDDFRPLMTGANIGAIQRNFLVIAAAEGDLRTQVLPRENATGSLPAARRFVGEWPRLSGEMAPMIGAMADNLDNFAEVDALPPFWLFPWFFVLPGVLVFGLAIAARPRVEPNAVPVQLATPATSVLERSAS